MKPMSNPSLESNGLPRLYWASFYVLLIAASFSFSTPPSLDHLSDTVDADIQRIVVDYAEKKMPVFRPEKMFAYCDYLGYGSKGSHLLVYAFLYINGFQWNNDQVVEGSAGNQFGVFHVRRMAAGLVIDSLQRFGKRDDMSELLPKRIYDKYCIQASEVPEREVCRKRVVAFFDSVFRQQPLACKLPAQLARCFDKPLPWSFSRWLLGSRPDGHGHNEDIYSHRNLRAAYENVALAELPDTAGRYYAKMGHDFMKYSPDKRFGICVVVISCIAPNGMILVIDRQKHRGFRLVGLANERIDNVTWKGENIVVFDQISGLDRFRPGSGGKGDPFGVHYEIDLASRAIRWAVPFGFLGFPEKRNNY